MASLKEVKKAVDNKPYITTTEGGIGWFAVHVWWNPEGFWEPYETGFGRYATEDGAIVEAKVWATQAGLEYQPRVKPEAVKDSAPA